MSNQKINTIEDNSKQCSHQVLWPKQNTEEKNFGPPQRFEGLPAKQYPFSIDPFQQTSIDCLEQGQSVLVAAHTSAGKTVIAEYAFGIAKRDNVRVIYTSPLKALSNQKFREFSETFSDVGLVTGDVNINPSASCLVMTTEILRSLLYKGSEIVKECSIVVFDEIHYIRDKERGVVWEETIIMLPKTLRLVFLSATIPNAPEFAQWIADLHQRPCNVVYTDSRPVPLQHYLFPSGGDGIYMVVDESGKFRQDNFVQAVSVISDDADLTVSKKRKRKMGADGKGNDIESLGTEHKDKPDIYKLVKMIIQRNLDPVIIFSFSKRECEELANMMVSLDVTNEDEKKLIDQIFWSAMDILSDEDRKLPQVRSIILMLKRGFGIHHSGLLPIIKEIIEIMFQEGLLKVLFATETFSTGLNMPAKTVVFTNAKKFDGLSFRWLSSGIVILMANQKMEPPVIKEMVKGSPDLLYSEFHLSYSMIINILKLDGEDSDPRNILRKSFKQFQLQNSLPKLQEQVIQLNSQKESIIIQDEDLLKQYIELLKQKRLIQDQIADWIQQPKHLLPYIQPGRLILVKQNIPVISDSQLKQLDYQQNLIKDNYDNLRDFEIMQSLQDQISQEKYVWGVIVSFEKVNLYGSDQANFTSQNSKKRQKGDSQVIIDTDNGDQTFIVDILINCNKDYFQEGGTKNNPQICHYFEKGIPQVIGVATSCIVALSQVRIYLNSDLRQIDNRKQSIGCMQEAIYRLQESQKEIPLLDPLKNLKIEDKECKKHTKKLQAVQEILDNHQVQNKSFNGNKKESLQYKIQQLNQKQNIQQLEHQIKKEIKEAQDTIFKGELKGRQKLLKRLNYFDDQGIIQKKGYVASQIQSTDEVLLSEMMFQGIFREASAQQIAAILSCFVWGEKVDYATQIRQEVQPLYQQLKITAQQIAQVGKDCKLDISVDTYVNQFRPELMEVVWQWYGGSRFYDIVKSSNLYEGSIVRGIRRLEELLRQLIQATQVIGDQELQDKFETATEKIKRDIVFAASLYL